MFIKKNEFENKNIFFRIFDNPFSKYHIYKSFLNALATFCSLPKINWSGTIFWWTFTAYFSMKIFLYSTLSIQHVSIYPLFTSQDMNQSVFLNSSLHHTLHFSFCKIPENFLICPPTRHGWERAKKIWNSICSRTANLAFSIAVSTSTTTI